MKRVLLAWLVLLGANSAAWAQPWSLPSDEAIRAILADRIDNRKQSVGIVVGIVSPQGRRVISHGQPARSDSRPLDGRTVFEIGSVTKVFNALLLADMAVRKEIALDDPVAKYLPANVRVPERAGKQITLQDLATHTSGLPRLPNNMPTKDPLNPYADYTSDQLYQFLGGYTLTRDIGSQFEYSNLGAGLLGNALSRRARRPYEVLIRERITARLGMRDTAITLTPSMRARFAVGHDAALKPVPYWDLPTLAGSGALRSTANDLLIMLENETGLRRSAIRAAMDRQLSTRRPGASSDTEIALGWQVRKHAIGTIFFHSGGTGGFRTFVAFNPQTREGVVALANASTPVGVDDIGMHILVGEKLADPRPPVTHTEVALDRADKEKLVGRYRLSANSVLTMTLEGEQLFAQVAKLPKDRVFAASPTLLFWRGEDGDIRFELGPDGRAMSAIVRFNGRETVAKREDAS